MNAAQRATLGESACRALTALGVPDLPDGYLWRIKQEEHSDHVIRVEVRKLNPDVGTTRLSWATFSTRQGEEFTLAAVRACHEAYADAFPEGVPA